MNINHFCFISLGCPKNLVDSERVIQSMIEAGFTLVQEHTTESIALLNTCAFIKEATDETISVIQELIQRKINKELNEIVVLGCFPTRFIINELKKEFPQVDHWITIKQEAEIGGILSQTTENSPLDKEKISLTPRHYAYLKISEGCNNLCSYCVIPKIRGPLKSRPLEDILKEAEYKVSCGIKELILVAEDTTIWGADTYNTPSLSLLLNALNKIETLKWIRIMYAYPGRVDQQLINTIKECEKVCHYLDMPIQHANTTMLKAMNRHYTKDELISCMKNLKNTIPNIAIRTSVIIGFPGETQAQFNELLSFIKRYPFSQLGAFGYSQEQETQAAALPNQINNKTINQRINTVMKQQFKLVESENETKIGQKIKLLYEGMGQGRSQYQAPDVDNVVIVDNPEGLEIGEFYTVEIIRAYGYDLVGRIIK
ncbi:30S ribosomal protein S12 methylthiotransferase RimO [Thermoproteota archaeon]